MFAQVVQDDFLLLRRNGHTVRVHPIHDDLPAGSVLALLGDQLEAVADDAESRHELNMPSSGEWPDRPGRAWRTRTHHTEEEFDDQRGTLRQEPARPHSPARRGSRSS